LAAYSYRVPSPSSTSSSASDANGTYTGTRITFADHDLLYGDWEPIRRMYDPGRAVQVFFDPRAPHAAVLERRVPFAWFTPYAIWGTIGFGVLMLALSFWRRAATWPGGARDLVP